MKTFHLHIVTPTSDFYSGEIESLSVDTPDGREGFLCGALPRVLMMKAGVIEIETSVLNVKIISGDGFVCVDDKGVTILAESCRFEDDEAPPDTSDAQEQESMREYKVAKANMTSTFIKMSGKGDK